MSCSNHYLCHVEEMNVKWVFLFFGILGKPIRRLRGVIYTPSRGLSRCHTNRAALCPMGPAVPVLTLFFDAFGSGQGELLRFSSSYCTTFHVSTRVHYEYTLKIHNLTLYLVFGAAFVRYSVHFPTTLASLVPEAPALPCVFPRSPVRSAEVFRLAVQLVPVPFLPYHKLLLRRISSSHSCRLGYSAD